MMLPLAGIFQTIAGLLAVAIVVGCIAYGFMHGMFRSVLVGMQALVAFVVTMTFIPALTEILIAIDMPPSYAFPAALFILAIGTAVGIHMLIEKYIPSESVPLLSVIDKIGGAFIGGAAGYVAAGGVLIALSLMPLPEIYQLNHAESSSLILVHLCYEPLHALSNPTVTNEISYSKEKSGQLLVMRMTLLNTLKNRFHQSQQTYQQDKFLPLLYRHHQISGVNLSLI